jgi:hypothetical protein
LVGRGKRFLSDLGEAFTMARILAALLLVSTITVSASADTVIVTREGCAALQRYVPSADVEYRPGHDVVNGKSVAPADLDGGVPPIKLPEEIEVVISVELQQRLGIPVDSTLYKPETFLGSVVVKPDGRAYYNGQPLQNDAAYELAQLCQKQGATPRSNAH